MSDVEFVDDLPPASVAGRPRGAGAYAAIAALCRANPGKWTELKRGPIAKRLAIAASGYKFADRYDLTYATRRVGDEVICYVSYEGKRKELQ